MFLYELSYYINRIEKVMYRLKIQHKFIVLKNHSVNQQTFRNIFHSIFYLVFRMLNPHLLLCAKCKRILRFGSKSKEGFEGPASPTKGFKK